MECIPTLNYNNCIVWTGNSPKTQKVDCCMHDLYFCNHTIDDTVSLHAASSYWEFSFCILELCIVVSVIVCNNAAFLSQKF